MHNNSELKDKKETAIKLSSNGKGYIANKRASDRKKRGRSEDPRNAGNYARKALQCLRYFDCPVCHCRETVRVDLQNTERKAYVRCLHCMRLEPKPANLPYPFVTGFVPRLENRADVFFKFNELYGTLVSSGSLQSAAPRYPSAMPGEAVSIADMLFGDGEGDEEDEENENSDEEGMEDKDASDEKEPLVASTAAIAAADDEGNDSSVHSEAEDINDLFVDDSY